MEFLRVVEEELRGLAGEARRRHPVVQEAAERAILKLRNMREEYAVALRRQYAGQAPPLSMFRSQDLLRPFLLACNHSDASPHLIIMAMGSIQYLINRDAILPSDAPNILRVLGIQSQSKEADVQKRVLQTMVMVVTWKSCQMKEETIAQALSVCLGLHDAKNSMVRTAAHMTVRQIISLLFDRVAEELGVTKDNCSAPTSGVTFGAESDEYNEIREGGVGDDEERDGIGSAEGALRCAHLVFQDLCVLSRGEQGQWIKRTSVSTTLGLELVEQVLAQQPVLFRRFRVLRRLLSKEVYALILQTLRRRMGFPLLVRVVRCAATLAVTYGDLLPKETQTILSIMLASLGAGLGSRIDEGPEGEGTIDFSPVDDGTGGCVVSWSAMLTLEAAHRVLSSPTLMLELVRCGGSNGTDPTVVRETVHAISQYIVRNLSTQHSVQAFETMAQSIRLARNGSGSGSSSSSGEGRRLPLPTALAKALVRGTSAAVPTTAGAAKGGGLSASGEGHGHGHANGSSPRSSSYELLHETEEPTLEEGELLLWALQCVVDFAGAVEYLIEEEMGTADKSTVVHSAAAVQPKEALAKDSRRDVLRRMCESVWGPVLSCLSHVLVHCSDPLIMATVADGYRSFAFASGFLGLETAVAGFIGSLCRFSLPQWHSAYVVVGGGMAGGGGGGGGSSQVGGWLALSWNHVGVLQSLLLVTHRLGNLLRASWHVVLDTLEKAAMLLARRAIARPRWSPHSLAEAELAEVEQHCMEVFRAVERLVQFSTCLEDEALYTLMSSLQALAVVDLANSSTLLPQERSAVKDSSQGPGHGHPGAGVGPGAAAVAAASGLVSMVGAAARAAMSGPEGRDGRDPRTSNNAPGGKSQQRNPWVSSHLVVECALANTWRLSVVWELISGHLRVVAKAREPTTREYAVRALSELIVDGVQRLHGVHPNPGSVPGVSNPWTADVAWHQSHLQKSSSFSTLTSSTPPHIRGTPSASQGGGGSGGGGMGGFISSLTRERSEEGAGQHEDGGEDGFRWVFEGDLSGVFVARERGGGVTARDEFEGVLFETMRLFALTPHVDTREATLQTLYTVLESCGQVLDSAWSVILTLLHSVAKAATDSAQALPPSTMPSSSPLALGPVGAQAGAGTAGEEAGESERSVAWGGGCLSLAFKCLHLIVDDFLERVPRDEVPKLVACTGAFGGQTENVNLSLTAIGMLWSVCDTLTDEGAPAGSNVNRTSSPGGTGGTSENDRASLHSMWPAMLWELRSLSIDFRPELRNCAVNTLFSAAVGNGGSLTEEEWKQFLLDVTFPLIEKVLESTNSASIGANTAVAPELKKGVRMLMHHTRDTDRKQWNETRVLAMQGLGRVLRAFVGDLARYSWFCDAGGVWTKSLQVYRDACLLGSDSQEVVLAGVDGISTMVLLVGRMGLKSVQVRAGTGMKIVNGTLQRQPSVKPSRGGGGGGDASTASGAHSGPGAGVASARGVEGGASTPEFARVRPALFGAAWRSMVEASGFAVDDSGDVASAFVLGLAAVYKGGMEEGAEFYPGQEDTEQRTQELFQVLESLMLPRVSPTDPSQPLTPETQRRTAYMPKVTPGQRAILEFLQLELRSGWQMALTLLAKFSVAPGWREGGGGEEEVTVECTKEAASALSAMMSERVPRRDRALALEGLIAEVSGPCLRRLEGLRSSRLGENRQAAGLEVAPSVEAGVSMRLSLDSYLETARLLLSLLSDGLPCLSDDATDGNGNGNSNSNGRFCVNPDTEKARVRAVGAAVKAVGCIAEAYRLDQIVITTSASPQAAAGAEGGSGGGGSEEFPRVLCGALSLVTTAVCRDVVPAVVRGSRGAEDVARALIDTLGGLTRPSPCCRAPSARAIGGEEIDGVLEAFRLAVTELCGMCGREVTEAGDWTQLGLPLRRRACWQLLRCAWSSARRFRETDDAEANEDGALDEAVRAAGERCTCALTALGKLRMPAGLLTADFRKLVADKQALENADKRRRHGLNTSSPPSSADENNHHSGGVGVSSAAAGRDDADWAKLAEGAGYAGNGQIQDGGGAAGTEEGGEQGHLMVVVQALLMCTASRSSLRVRQAAAELLGKADLPRAMDGLQNDIAMLKQELRKRDLELRKKEHEVGALRAQMAAGSFI